MGARSAMTVRAVIFDLDDTLIVEEATARASLRSAISVIPGVDPNASAGGVLTAIRSVWRSGPFHHLAVELGIASWEALWSRFEGCHPMLNGLATWAPAYRQAAWRAALGVLGESNPTLVPAMADAYEAAQRQGHPLLEGAADAVRRTAAAGHRLGLLTNGPVDIQRLKLERTGLADLFDAVVISAEAGVGKPSPGSFRLVLDALGTRPDQAVMVGDSWARDVQGACAAGLHAIWVSAGRPRPDTGSDAASVSSVAQVPAMLAL